jgi:glycine cleavage system regulatory protein
MREDLVLTVLGRDKPGLVEAIAKTVADHGGNWEASRMSHMAGRFAGILCVSVPAERVGELERAVADLEASGLRVHVEHGAEDDGVRQARELHLELVGPDRGGVVRDVSNVLAAQGVNIVELTSECRAAPMAGDVLLEILAELEAPESISLDQLRAAIETSVADFMVELDDSPDDD